MFAVGDICGKQNNLLRIKELNMFLYSFEQVLSAAKFWEYFQIKYAEHIPQQLHLKQESN